MTIHTDNLLDRRYYGYTSYYCLIEVPEPRRNIALRLGIEF